MEVQVIELNEIPVCDFSALWVPVHHRAQGHGRLERARSLPQPGTFPEGTSREALTKPSMNKPELLLREDLGHHLTKCPVLQIREM